MAIDEALLVRAECPTLRIYRWREEAVSLGYFDHFDEAARLAAGRPMVRRWTGGGLVEHGPDFTYTLVVPRTDCFLRHSAPESYRLIHAAIARWLAAAGIAAEMTASPDRKISSACFANLVPSDLETGGAKIAGAAQRRTRWGLLHQGSIRAGQPLAHSIGGLAAVFGKRVSRHPLSPEICAAAAVLEKTKYGTPAWLRKF